MDPKHSMSGTDPVLYFHLHVDTKQKERTTVGAWHSITKFTLCGCGWLALVGLVWLLTQQRVTLIIDP